MQIRLVEIPDIEANHQTEWCIRVLEINNRNQVLGKLDEWNTNSKPDYNKIMKVLRMIGMTNRIHDKKKVKKSANHDNVYEIRADKGNARLMFFYDCSERCVIVCTNIYWKSKSSKKEQNAAFALCDRLKKIYEDND